MTTDTLSPRETQVLECLSNGLNGTDAANKLGIAPSTVAQHKTKIHAKLKARTAAHAVAIGMRTGIIR